MIQTIKCKCACGCDRPVFIAIDQISHLCGDCYKEQYFCTVCHSEPKLNNLELCRGCQTKKFLEPPIVNEIISGFREYTCINGILRGMFSQNWPGRYAHYECKEGYNNYTRTMRRIPYQEPKSPSLFDCIDNGHNCGIWIKKDLINSREYGGDTLTHVIAWGEVEEFTEGYRVSDCRIEDIFFQCSPNQPPSSVVGKCELLYSRYRVPVSAYGKTSFLEAAPILVSIRDGTKTIYPNSPLFRYHYGSGIIVKEYSPSRWDNIR